MALDQDIAVSIGLDSSNFNRGMQQARQKTQELSGSMGGFSGMMNRHTQTMLEASRATEDFAIVLAGGGGVGAALRATANNIGVVLNSIHPLAGLFGTLGIAIGTMAVPALYRWITGTKDAEEAAKGLSNRIQELLGSANRIQQAWDRQTQIEGMFDVEAINDEIFSINRQIQSFQDEYNKLFIERLAIKQIPGSRTAEEVEAVNKRWRELNETWRRLIHERELLNKQALETIRKGNESDMEERRQKQGDAILKDSAERAEQQQRRDELERNLTQEFESAGITDPLERQLKAIRNQFEDRMAQIKKEFDGPKETELLGKAQTAMDAEMQRARSEAFAKDAKKLDRRDPVPQSQGAAQAGTAEAHRTIVAAMKGAEQREQHQQTKLLTQIAKNTKSDNKQKQILELVAKF